MYTLGFTNHYYTLWNVITHVRYGAGTVIDGKFNGQCWQVTNYNYCHNLSMDYDAAKAKITAIAGEGQWVEDLDLRGISGSFTKTVRMVRNQPHWQFTFGKLDCQDIRTCDDVWQLNRAMTDEVGGRRKVYARRRLIELGELVRRDWQERVYDEAASMALYSLPENQDRYDLSVYKMVARKYATKFQCRKLDEAAASGHWFTDGEKVKLELRRTGGFKFDSQYGTTYVELYMDATGRVFKYMGGRPIEIPETLTLVQATIKHSEYNGVKETKLLRMKLVK